MAPRRDKEKKAKIEPPPPRVKAVKVVAPVVPAGSKENMKNMVHYSGHVQIDQYFFTRVCTSTLGGLPGPRGLEQYVDAFRSYVNPEHAVEVKTCGERVGLAEHQRQFERAGHPFGQAEVVCLAGAPVCLKAQVCMLVGREAGPVTLQHGPSATACSHEKQHCIVRPSPQWDPDQRVSLGSTRPVVSASSVAD
ncbi:MAG: hypothetical protein WDW38_011043 [Sanguina aurantia]